MRTAGLIVVAIAALALSERVLPAREGEAVAREGEAVAREGEAPAEPFPATAAPIDFNRDIRPILERSCHSCHGPDEAESELRLDLKQRALTGGLSGPAIVPGKSGESRLFRYVSGLDPDIAMPPEGERLSTAEIDLLRRWIDEGAAWPDDEPLVAADPSNPGRWAFRPVVRPPLPAVADPAWSANPIDRFILATLETRDLSPAPPADRQTLIRRLSFDLLGLPPAPEEVERFVNDSDPLAYERLVERLLASPRYGERWGRHWLDVVRFAESHGFEMNQPRPNAWPYRDWVIAAFNGDVPYTQFIVDQLAGEAPEAEAATGFLVAGPWDQVKSPDLGLTLQQRMDELHDIVSTTSGAFLGLTVGCARCHNHKFDPVSQTDYYAIQAAFAGVEHGERPLVDPQAEEKARSAEIVRGQLAAVERRLGEFEPIAQVGANEPLRPSVNAVRNVDRFVAREARFVRFTILATNQGEPCLDELEIYAAGEPSRNLALASTGATPSSSGNYPGAEIHKLEHLSDGRYGNGRSWISNEPGAGWAQIELSAPAAIDRIVWGRDREKVYKDRLAVRYKIEIALAPEQWTVVATSDDRRPYEPDVPPELAHSTAGLDPAAADERTRLVNQRIDLAATLAALTAQRMAYAGKFVEPGETHRLHRGDPMQQREAVAPGTIAAIGPIGSLSAQTPERERRLALARWIADPANPLTARVLVNRIWHYRFGQGIVTTPSDLGANGGRPSHPELLDWLAAEFIQRGWSVKELHRLMVLSRTYRQSSRPNDAGLAIDASCRLLWRFPPRRLEAEAIRDAILATSGALDLTPGGPGYEIFEPNDNYVRVFAPKQSFGHAEWRRMVYQRRSRSQLDETFGPFDCPDGAQVAPDRNSSTTPLQALNLLNSPFMVQQSDLFAERLVREAGPESAAQIRLAFAIAFGREPDAGELSAAIDLIASHGPAAFCRAVFNANEFVYVD